MTRTWCKEPAQGHDQRCAAYDLNLQPADYEDSRLAAINAPTSVPTVRTYVQTLRALHSVGVGWDQIGLGSDRRPPSS
jgi:hypothetical protein